MKVKKEIILNSISGEFIKHIKSYKEYDKEKHSLMKKGLEIIPEISPDNEEELKKINDKLKPFCIRLAELEFLLPISKELDKYKQKKNK